MLFLRRQINASWDYSIGGYLGQKAQRAMLEHYQYTLDETATPIVGSNVAIQNSIIFTAGEQKFGVRIGLGKSVNSKMKIQTSLDVGRSIPSSVTSFVSGELTLSEPIMFAVGIQRDL